MFDEKWMQKTIQHVRNSRTATPRAGFNEWQSGWPVEIAAPPIRGLSVRVLTVIVEIVRISLGFFEATSHRI
jgi:hypothetical protein